MKQVNKKKLFISLILLSLVVLIMAITLTSCKGPIEGLNPEQIINQIFPNIWVVVGQLISMTILFVVIYFFLWKPSNKMLENRRKLIMEELEEGKRLQDEANAKLVYAETLEINVKKQADTIIADANLKSCTILEEAEEQARLTKEKIINDANAQAQRDVQKLKNDAELEIVNTILKTTELLMKKEITKKDNEKFVKDFLSNL